MPCCARGSFAHISGKFGAHDVCWHFLLDIHLLRPRKLAAALTISSIVSPLRFTMLSRCEASKSCLILHDRQEALIERETDDTASFATPSRSRQRGAGRREISRVRDWSCGCLLINLNRESSQWLVTFSCKNKMSHERPVFSSWNEHEFNLSWRMTRCTDGGQILTITSTGSMIRPSSMRCGRMPNVVSGTIGFAACQAAMSAMMPAAASVADGVSSVKLML